MTEWRVTEKDKALSFSMGPRLRGPRVTPCNQVTREPRADVSGKGAEDVTRRSR